MNADVLTTRVADGIAVITLGSARRIYFDQEMGDALTEALDGFAGDAKVRVVGLVYICALAPDADETSQTQQSKFPRTDVFSHIEVVDGRIWLRPEGTKYFCGDLSEQEQKLVWATQGVPKPDLFEAKVGGTAWKSKPSWYIVGKNDRTVHPDLERFFAKRMKATTHELESSHVPMLSKPNLVLDVIRAAANSAQADVRKAAPASGR